MISRAMWITFIGTRSNMDGYSKWRNGPIQAFTLMCVAVFTQRIGAAKSLPMLRPASDAIDAVPFGHRILRADP